MAAKNTKALMIYLNNREVLEALSDAERGQLTLALLDYLEYGSLPGFTGALGMAFLVLRKDVDRSVERWEEECARRSAAGKKSAALRAAKKFTSDVSYKSDTMSDIPEEASFNDPEECSTALNRVEAPPTDGANTYPNANQNQYSNANQNQYSNANQNANTNTYVQKTGAGREMEFTRFWAAYPKKVGKQAARKAFLRTSVPLDTILAALERQRAEPQWQRENGRFIPHPVTWLNQARWEDEPAAATVDPDLYGVESL